MRGERPNTVSTLARTSGSSPHARGTHATPVFPLVVLRFIPACAGNAWIRCMIMTMADGSSPHARGTHPPGQGREAARRFIPACAGNAWIRCMIMTMADGSSPHARGTPTFQFQRHNKARFIPACAGNALAARSPAHRRPVHPRMRGERGARRLKTRPQDGSSPHARGTPVPGLSGVHWVRFIPECAGNAMASRMKD